jgi:hypothetical protein
LIEWKYALIVNENDEVVKKLVVIVEEVDMLSTDNKAFFEL